MLVCDATNHRNRVLCLGESFIRCLDVDAIFSLRVEETDHSRGTERLSKIRATTSDAWLRLQQISHGRMVCCLGLLRTSRLPTTRTGTAQALNVTSSANVAMLPSSILMAAPNL